LELYRGLVVVGVILENRMALDEFNDDIEDMWILEAYWQSDDDLQGSGHTPKPDACSQL
jgi:hypothetical protein